MSKGPRWSDVKKVLIRVWHRGLLALVKELYELSPENGAHLAARFAPEPTPGVLEKFRKRVVEPFYPARGGSGELRFGDARKAVRDYEKATNDVKGTLDLMLAFVENGTAFTNEFGDIDARFYDSLEAMLVQFLTRIQTEEGRPYYEGFKDRLIALAKATYNIGWGYGDNVNAAITELVEAMGGDASEELG